MSYPKIKKKEKEGKKMLKYNAGDRVGKGTYWNFSNGERIDIDAEGVLAGDGGTAYYRIPATSVVLMGPVIGLVYAVFLPFIGIAMSLRMLTQKIAGRVHFPVRGVATFGWRPSESYLAGKKRKKS